MTTIREISDIAALERAVAEPNSLPLLLFKHSTRCHISSAAFRELSAFAASEAAAGARLALVHVVEHRDVSNRAAELLGVRHQSPQAILIVDGRVVWHDSHEMLRRDTLGEALAAAAASALPLR